MSIHGKHNEHLYSITHYMAEIICYFYLIMHYDNLCQHYDFFHLDFPPQKHFKLECLPFILLAKPTYW